ncbi:MAG: ketopantoate reductase family protein [Chloroflexi bacterium]|nr:ketopantoate reductase family protein [Chloroflexota bacterium]
MRVVIAGAGALGTCYAVLLARAGVEVCVLAKPGRIEALRGGLRVSGLVDASAQVEVVLSGRDAERADYVFLVTKTADTAAALRALEAIDAGSVLSLQNGLAKDDALAAAFGRERVIGAACAVGAAFIEPGHARLTMNAATWVGELDRGSSERVARLAAVLRAAGFPAWSVPNIRAVEWYKLCALLPGAFVTALSRRSYDEMALHPDLAPLFVQLMREVFAVPQAAGVTIADPPGSPWRFAEWLAAHDEVALAGLRTIGERQRAAGEKVRPSMLQDVLAGRKTEAEDVAGELVRHAHRLGVAIPATETCYRLIRGLEDGFAQTPPGPVAH